MHYTSMQFIAVKFLDLLITLKQQLVLSSAFFQISHIPTFIFASEASCCLGLGADCCGATVAVKTVNHDLWPCMENNGNGKLHTGANNVVSPLWPLFYCLQSRFHTALFPDELLRRAVALRRASLLLATLEQSHDRHDTDRQFLGHSSLRQGVISTAGVTSVMKYSSCLDQASFDHVKVGSTPVLALHNLWRQIHMFIPSWSLKKNTKKLEKKLFR